MGRPCSSARRSPESLSRARMPINCMSCVSRRARLQEQQQSDRSQREGGTVPHISVLLVPHREPDRCRQADRDGGNDDTIHSRRRLSSSEVKKAIRWPSATRQSSSKVTRMFIDAARSLRASPAVTLFILFILTLTISVATTTFAIVDAVVLRPLPFDEPDDIVAIQHHGGNALTRFSALEFLALRDRTRAFSALAAVVGGSVSLQADGKSDQVSAARVTSSLFDVLQVRPLIGETFTAAHETAGTDRVAVISYRLWHGRFGGDPGIVGQTIEVADGPLLVLGVMPEGFSYPIDDDRLPEVWTPYVIPQRERLPTQQSAYLHVVGRLRSGTSLAQAQSQVDAVRMAVATIDPSRYSPTQRFGVTLLEDAIVGSVRGWMVLVLGAVCLLLAIACANVANLLLTRAIDRARELAIRAALGATRTRLVTSLLVESLMLSLSAVMLGLLAAWWGVDAAKHSLPPEIARAQSIALDFRVFAVAVAAAVVTGCSFGVLPALRASRSDLIGALTQGTASVTPRSGWRTSVLVAEIAFVSVLLVATALFVSSFIRLTHADLGFDRSHLLVTAQGDLQGTLTDVVQRLESIPGVIAVGGASGGSPPLVAGGFKGGSSATRLRQPDMPLTDFVTAEFTRVSARYFAAARIPVLRGRVFGEADLPTLGRVVLDEVAARRLFGERDPIGREVMFGRSRATVVGVVANVRTSGPEADPRPQAYFPGPTNAAPYAFLIRTAVAAHSLAPAVQAAIATMRPRDSRPAQIRPVEDAFRNITARRRFSAGTMALFGTLALVLGSAGVFGVMSTGVARRTREIGVRMALGATGLQIVVGVLGQAARHLGLGLLLGLPVAWVISQRFAAFLFQVRPTDAWVYLVVAGLLSLVGFLAALVPARRASLIDPLTTLRCE
jgi:putative ABC transport system permease protein